MLRSIPFMPNLSRTFIIGLSSILSKAFLKFNEMIKWFCLSVYVKYCIHLFIHVEPSLYLWHEAYLFVVDDNFGMFLDLVGKHFIKTFYIYVHKELGLKFCLIFMWLQIVSSKNKLDNVLCFYFVE